MFSTRCMTTFARKRLLVRAEPPETLLRKLHSSRSRAPFSALIQQVPWASSTFNEDRKKYRTALYQPPIQILPLHQSRWFATTTKDENKELDHHDDDDDTTLRKRITDRAEHFRDDVKLRAGEIRTTTKQEWNEFREHPGASARKGAISFGTMMRQYGPVFVGTYAAVYFTTLGTLFVGVQSGLLDPSFIFSWFGGDGAETKSTVEYVVDFMNSHAWLEGYSSYIEKNPAFANLAVAWIAVKFTEPIRFAAAVAVTPRVARYFGRTAAAGDEEAEATEENHADAAKPEDIGDAEKRKRE